MSDGAFKNWPVLHIFGQNAHHDDAVIIGTRTGLLALRNAIDAALQTADSDECELTQNDGEYYGLHVRCVADAWVPAIPTAYTEFQADWNDTRVIGAFNSILAGMGFDGGQQ